MLICFLVCEKCYSQIYFKSSGFVFPIDTSLLSNYKLHRIVLKDFQFNSSAPATKKITSVKEFSLDTIKYFSSDSLMKLKSKPIDKNSTPVFSQGRLVRMSYQNENNQLNGFDLYLFDEYRLLHGLNHYEINSIGEIILIEKINIHFRK